MSSRLKWLGAPLFCARAYQFPRSGDTQATRRTQASSPKVLDPDLRNGYLRWASVREGRQNMWKGLLEDSLLQREDPTSSELLFGVSQPAGNKGVRRGALKASVKGACTEKVPRFFSDAVGVPGIKLRAVPLRRSPVVTVRACKSGDREFSLNGNACSVHLIFKNVKTIWAVSCKPDNNKMLADWRKTSEEIISLQLVSGAASSSVLFEEGPEELMGLSVDASCDSYHIVQKLLAEDAVKKKTVVLLWSDTATIPKEAISHLLSPEYTDLFLAVPTTNDTDKVQVYNSKLDVSMIWDGREIQDYSRRPTLSGRVVRGMITLKDKRRHNSNLVDILEEKSAETVDDNLMKFSFVLHQFLEKMFDFRWHLHLSGSRAIGEVYVSRNGTLDYFMDGSQFGALKTGFVDVGLYPAEILPSALDSFEILPPLTTLRQFFVFSSPITALEPHMAYSMFSREVWLVSVCLALLMAMVSTISTQTAAFNDENDKEFTFFTNVLIAVGALAQQGLERSSEKLSVRISHFFLLFLTLMLFMFYNTGFLIYTLNPTQKEIKSFKELIRRGYAVSAEDTPYNRFQLQGNYSHPSEWFHHNCQDGWGSCKTEIAFHNLSTGAEILKNTKTAFFGYASNIYGILEDITTDKEKGDLRELPVHKPYAVGTFVRKQFPYKELFRRGLLLLKEAGITFHEDQKWNFKKPDPLLDSFFVIASLYSTSVAFILLFYGVFFSLVILLLEIFIKRENPTVKLGKAIKFLKRRCCAQLGK
ncbi:hypothetical protein GE061_020088 [Apolygus lucorum]|uniref:Ionotropic glutamate receptor C-terminal domain-containing protein n=1 Tax=Apolygus lucorum TaxID=248454 RepID=A0A8S9XA62_APOLU|nr:hypothetical protein GE061_020088 [Apolygus lucorum]